MRSLLAFSMAGIVSIAPAQVINNWTNPASARWDSSSSWSLAKVPASNQTINITNGGYKAVNIDGATVASFPESMTVSNLFVAAPSNALSTLLLNYAGLAAPLKVLNGCTIGTNGNLQNSYSRLEVHGVAGGTLDISGGGAFIQEGGQTLAPVPIRLIDGEVKNINGNMTLGQLNMGGGSGPASFTQDGGSIATDYLLMNGGIFTLNNGILYVLSGSSVTGYFYQFGGTNYGDVAVMSGGYKLHGGLVQGNAASFGSSATMEHRNGRVEMAFMTVTGGATEPETFPSNPSYALYQGQVFCGTLNIGANGLFEQQGGLVTLTNNLDLHGFRFITSRGIITEYSDYRLVGGVFTAPSISMGELSILHQYSGTNLLTGSGLTITGGVYGMEDGRVETAYTGVGFPGVFNQRHGRHKINGVLSVTGNYDLGGGTVEASGFYLSGFLDVYTYYDTAAFIVRGLTDLGGTLWAGASNIELGQMRLSTNSLIDFRNELGQVTCANSADVAWTPRQMLVITNWHGGTNHISFGTDASGLTAAQLAQIQFSNPGGFATGVYPAQLLATGELVPVPRPILQMTQTGSALVLAWTGSYQLLSSTNVNGPYQPVPNASSPWTNSLTKPQEFFTLHGL